MKSPEKPFGCTICKTAFTHLELLGKHVKACHLNNQSKLRKVPIQNVERKKNVRLKKPKNELKSEKQKFPPKTFSDGEVKSILFEYQQNSLETNNKSDREKLQFEEPYASSKKINLVPKNKNSSFLVEIPKTKRNNNPVFLGFEGEDLSPVELKEPITKINLHKSLSNLQEVKKTDKIHGTLQTKICKNQVLLGFSGEDLAPFFR